ncbi:helix-turn-helix transcriptional regulator [Streptomyces sp. NPDC019396]|uniref:helix-turn-helix domain-containing protein n=1 Tax=Streptomyces sp. NPDC019396 TaxID=3154687 RepID=UPI0033E20B12
MSEIEYGFDAAKLRAARLSAGLSVARIAQVVGVSERAGLYFAGSRVPRPGILLRLARAVGVEPAELCTVERERLAHLRVWSGRNRAQMAQALGMSEATYRQVEITGHRGRSHYDWTRGCWVAWQEWAPPVFGVTPERLAAAEQATQDHHQAERERRLRMMREQNPERAARLDRLLGRRL